jgi:hypothetical protein
VSNVEIDGVRLPPEPPMIALHIPTTTKNATGMIPHPAHPAAAAPPAAPAPERPPPIRERL